MDAKAVSHALDQLLAAERALGRERTREEYAELFPGFEDAVAAALGAAHDAPRPVADVQIGQLGRYRILRELGRGGQAVVYLAEDPELRREVALKVLTGAGPASEQALQRFRREAEVCSRLQNPGICTVHDTGIAGGLPFIAMQYVAGLTLSARIASSFTDPEDDPDSFTLDTALERDAPRDPDGRAEDLRTAPADRKAVLRAVGIIERAARALHAAHQAGIIHRDVKPGNIIVDEDDQPVLLDFGLAHDLDETSATLTRTGEFFGTPAYMSPEQISAHRIGLDHRTDVFSLGVVLYECVTGRRPFDASTREGIYQAILAKSPPDPRNLNPAVPRDLWIILQTALDKDRDRRYATANAFADDLAALTAFRPITARPVSLPVRALRWAQRNPGTAALASVLAVVLVVAGGLALLQYGEIERARDEAASAKIARKLTRDELLDRFEALESSANLFNAFIFPSAVSETVAGVRDLGDEGLEFVLSQLRSERDSARLTAAQLLLHLDDPRAIPELTRVSLDDPSLSIAAHASQALIRLDGDGIVPALRRLAASERTAIRVNGLWGLCRQGDAWGIEQATDFYQDGEQPQAMRRALGASIPMITRPELMELVDDVVEDATNMPTILDLAIYYYKKVGNAPARDGLARLARDAKDAEVREKAQRALDALPRPE